MRRFGHLPAGAAGSTMSSRSQPGPQGRGAGPAGLGRFVWMGLFALAVLALGAPAAWAARIPAKANIGLGPTIGTVLLPSLSGPPGLSFGVALTAEGWVNERTLHSKTVMRRVPQNYKGMVREMDDMHVIPFPLGLLPDVSLIVPITGQRQGQQVRAVGWTPISLYLAHDARPTHKIVRLSPRVGWLSLDAEAGDALGRSSHIFLGVDVDAERQSPMRRTFGSALGVNVAPGFVGPRTIAGVAEAGGFGVWVDAYARLQWRKDLRVKI